MTNCASIGCTAEATEQISYVYRGQGEREADKVCTPCADGYSRRPVLHDLQRWPLVPNPVPASWPGDPFAGIPNSRDEDNRPF